MVFKTDVVKKALVTGSFGQDGSYLIELLANKGYQITATHYPQHSLPKYLEPLKGKVDFAPLDIADFKALEKVLSQNFYDEIYNLAAVSFVPDAASSPLSVKKINTDAVCFMLDFLNSRNLSTRFFQATSAYIFDMHQNMPLNLDSKINPKEPYGITKAASFFWSRFYRQYYHLYIVNGLLFNHESPRRPDHFVIPKIINQAIEIKQGKRKFIKLGNLEVARDWGWAPDFVEAMWLSLQQATPDDYIIATGQAHKLTEVLDIVFDYLKIDNWPKYVKTDPAFLRSDDPPAVFGDIKSTSNKLKWRPKLSFKQMIINIIKAKLDEKTN
ncbi:MAG: NAD-dependent epimerase/dehydratase family protein [bacterium]|nr:NAD-dependent epimerase/dehydratase family protein [bacterium]